MTARILLAEDNDSLAQMLQMFLTAQGHKVTHARTGVDALRMLVTEQIDLLLLDLRLPTMSGVEVLQKIRQSPRWKELPVIVMTGVYKGDKYAEAARRLGVQHYLEKPFSKDLFNNAVATTLAEIDQKKSSTTVLEMILDIYNSKRTGLLTIGDASPVSFIKGEPYSFLSRGKKDFPSFLVSKGKISSEDLKLFLESGEERLFLTQSGMLTYDMLLEESQLFQTSFLMEKLAESENVTFSDGVEDEELPMVHIPVPRLIYDATKFYPAHFKSEEFLAKVENLYPARTRLFYRRANLTTMRKEDIDLLEMINGQTMLSDIIPNGPGRGDAAGFFNFLYLLGMIDLKEDPTTDASPDFPLKHLFNRPIEDQKLQEETAIGFDDLVLEVSASVELPIEASDIAAPLSAQDIDFEQRVLRDYTFISEKNYYELFEMTSGSFSFAALKESYFSKTREYSPERLMELPWETQNLAQEVLAAYGSAYNTLSNVVSKERYDEMLNADKTLGLDGKQDDRLQARVQFQSGSVFLEMGEFENAEKSLQEAYTLEPENCRHCAYLGWAIYKNPQNARSQAAQEKAKNLLTRSLQLDKTAEAFSFRGWMLLDEGRDGLAEGEFLKALKLNPKEMNARKGLRQITEKREAEKKGIFKRLFG